MRASVAKVLPDAEVEVLTWNGKLEAQLTLHDKVDRFNTWAKAQNFPILKIEAAILDNGVLGGIATSSLSHYETFISIPMSATINWFSAGNDPRVGPLISAVRDAVLDLPNADWDEDFDPLLLYLVHERFITREAGALWPYIALFPSHSELRVPLQFTDDELLDVKWSELFDKVRAYKSFLKTTFYTKWWATAAVTEAAADIITWPRYVWAALILDTRSILVSEHRHLIPVFDLVMCAGLLEGCVHSTKTNIRGQNANIVITAGSAVSIGNQVMQDCGAVSSLDMPLVALLAAVLWDDYEVDLFEKYIMEEVDTAVFDKERADFQKRIELINREMEERREKTRNKLGFDPYRV